MDFHTTKEKIYILEINLYITYLCQMLYTIHCNIYEVLAKLYITQYTYCNTCSCTLAYDIYRIRSVSEK